MARVSDARPLDTGDAFPRLSIDMLGGGRITLPEDLLGQWSVVLFTRGHW